MQDDKHQWKHRRQPTRSEGTRGFVIGAVGAAVLILVFMALFEGGLFDRHDLQPDAIFDGVPTGDGE
ncbi:hypothetical protein AB2N04_05120 [Nitratireductor sp. GISD-1A_MAKvit]|uniref:hypothetical protein n=1 Tax=Nitratireductor sp. GISD-1A_MAKvit TaxID=3234198 RepID=UPI003467B635